MNPVRLKKEQSRARRFASIYEDARADAIRDAKALVALLEARGTLRKVHDASYDVHMSTGLLYSHAAWLAKARQEVAQVRDGKRVNRGRPILSALGWPDPSDAYNARQKRERGEA